MKKTIMIFGASSFVGSNLADILKDDYRIIGTYFKTPIEIPGITCVPCDVLKKDYVTSLISRFKPDISIYTVGMSSLTDCKNNPKQADALNSAGAVNVCTASERYGSKFVYLSSCFVLGGEDQNYKEGDTPFPNTTYGTSLSSTEFYVQRSCLNYLILRCSPMYGRSFNPKHPNWFEYLQSGFAHGTTQPIDDTVITGFLDIYIVARILKSAFQSNVTNRLFQVSSKDSISRYDFAQIFTKVFKKDKDLIQKSSAQFPIDLSSNKQNKIQSIYHFKMDTSNVEDFLQTKMPTVLESLQLTYKRFSS